MSGRTEFFISAFLKLYHFYAVLPEWSLRWMLLISTDRHRHICLSVDNSGNDPSISSVNRYSLLEVRRALAWVFSLFLC